MSKEANRRRLLCITALFVLGIGFVTNPLTHVLASGGSGTNGLLAARGFATLLLMPALAGSVLAISQLLRERADVAGLTGSILAVMGFTAGTRIMLMSQLNALAHSGIDGVPPEVLTTMFRHAPIVYLSIVPTGIFFPIGLLILGIAIVAVHPVSRWTGALLIAGAILFPLGRAVGINWAIPAADLALGATFLWIARESCRAIEL